MAVRRDRASQRERTLPELDAALSALAKTMERHGRNLVGQDHRLREVAELVETLAERLTQTDITSEQVTAAGSEPASSPPGGQPPPDNDHEQSPEDGENQGDDGLPSWLVVTDWEQAQAMMDCLAPWVETIYLRWPDASLPSCWALHPHAVEELWTLRCAWYDARTGDGASWLKTQDWHDRQRPSVARRLREGLERCSLLEHEAPQGPAHPVLPGADTLPQVVTAWATDDHRGWPPALSARQIADERDRLRDQPAATATRLTAPRAPTVRRSLSEA